MWWKRKQATNFLIRKTDGSVDFGDNWEGQLANGESQTNQLEPFRFLEANVTQIAASWSFGAALLNNGSLHMFGGNFAGQFGDGTTTDRNRTTEVFSTGIAQISVGSTHTMIIKDDGSLWTAGGGQHGQLGNGKNGGTHADFDEGIDTKTFFQVASSNATRLPNFHEYNKPNFSPDLNSTVNLEMIWVEPGTFTMGSPVTEANRATNEIEHNVTFTKGFYLGKYEVTRLNTRR